MRRATGVDGWIIADACRWYACRAIRIDNSSSRASIEADVVAEGSMRDFYGLNRAMHAVVEGAIARCRSAGLNIDNVRAPMPAVTPAATPRFAAALDAEL